MSGNEKASGKAGGLPRRQFVRLSGVVGTAALLAGTGAGKDRVAGLAQDGPGFLAMNTPAPSTSRGA